MISKFIKNWKEKKLLREIEELQERKRIRKLGKSLTDKQKIEILKRQLTNESWGELAFVLDSDEVRT